MTTTRRSAHHCASRAAAAAAAAGVALVAACASPGGTTDEEGARGFAEAQQEEGSPITVWVDASRAAAADAFTAANPDVEVDVVTYDGSANGSDSFKTKIGLLDRAGDGWPDVVFSTQNNDAAWASQGANGQQPFAAVLDQGLIGDDVLGGFTEGSLDPCTVDGSVYCLRNDLAQGVLWYDQSLMDEFGYELPTTWEEYGELSARVAEEHPGYITGSVGDPWTPEIFFWASRCQANDVEGPSTMVVDTTSPECQRAAELVDAGVEQGWLTDLSVFSPEFVQQYSGKVVMMPGPAWFAGAIFDNPDSLAVPPGQIGVAPPLPWGDEDAVTGNVGGGTWFVSSHSRNLEAATQFVEFVTTADDYQVEQAPGYPAYAPAADKWVSGQEDSGYYASDLAGLTEAAPLVWSGWGAPAFSQEAIWAKTMQPLLTSGQPLTDELDTWQQAIEDQAQVFGYSVQ
ncbi:ABC transporter substrate-binding protein [Pseudokineococcus sp. 5B2Z-1]|uniref:ABC transporter substrate-binding protein n=1 Tax=Pseudokineococcus sp. 5B2Z-1 TaxID=3132744 RepID=UPI0030A1B803